MLRTRITSATRILRALPIPGLIAGFFAALAPTSTQTAVANGDTRTIYLYHAHTKESIAATFRVSGSYDSAALKKLNWFLRDWRRDEPTNMDPRLFDTVWEVYRNAGAESPVWVVSAYRSPETNSMLRRRSRAVAKHSQHMLGKAMDTHMPGLSMARVREIGVKLQRGGVGWYPTAGTPFVHLDVGSVRSWPRLSYDHLARLFPDGKTVHLPAGGGAMPGYEQARAEIEARGGQAYDIAEVTGKSKGFFASLFGGGDDEEEVAAATPTRGRVGRLPPRGRNAAVAAYAPQSGDVGEDGGRNIFAMNEQRPEPVVRAERDLPRGETFLSPAAPAALKPTPVEEPTRAETRAARTQLAALAPPAADIAIDTKKFGELAPVPPRRPADLVTTSFADAPLPPVRPVRLAALGDTSSAPKLSAKSGLPALITRGSTSEPARLPPAALAYASTPTAATRSETVTTAKVAAKDADRANLRAATSAGPERPAIAPPVAGLRRAARAEAAVLANAPAPGVTSQFGAGILPSGGFSGGQKN